MIDIEKYNSYVLASEQYYDMWDDALKQKLGFEEMSNKIDIEKKNILEEQCIISYTNKLKQHGIIEKSIIMTLKMLLLKMIFIY